MKNEDSPFFASRFWLCEGCGAVTEGADPPDACKVCDHKYFENLYDLEFYGDLLN